MKILFLSQIVPYPPHGGVLQRGYNIIREIAKENDVYLLAFVHPDTLGSEELIVESKSHLEGFCKSVDFFSLWPKKSVMHKYIAFSAGFLYPKPFSVLAHKSSGYNVRLHEIIENNDINVIHYDTIGLAGYHSEKQNIPTLLTHHNIESTLMARRSKVESSWLARIYVGLQAKRLKRYETSQSLNFDINIMMSKTDELELKAMVPSVKTDIVPNGVDIEYFSVSNLPQEKAIIYTGGMNMFANKDAVLHLIEDIWPKIKARIPGAIFYVIGQDPPDELLKISAQDSSIKVLGYVDDVRPYVAKSSVYVVPLRVGGGTRLKVLDALAQGKAIVSTAVGCEGIEVTDGLNIHIENNDVNFSNRVIELLNNQARRCELGMAARILVEKKYDWASIAQILQRAYENIKRS